MFFFALSSFKTGWNEAEKKVAQSKYSEEHGLILLKHGSDNGYTWGEVRNDTDKVYITASIKVKYYDEGGKVIKDGVDLVSNLNPGEIWKFKIYEPKEPGKYDVAQPTGRWKK
jgi:hypothetical protein